MRVRLDFIAPSGLVNGRRDVELVLEEGSTIWDMVLAVCDEYGNKARQMLLQGDGKSPYVQFIMHNKVVPPDRKLKDGDMVTVLPPIGGG